MVRRVKRFSRIQRLHTTFYKTNQSFKLKDIDIDIMNMSRDRKEQKLLKQRPMPTFELYMDSL